MACASGAKFVLSVLVAIGCVSLAPMTARGGGKPQPEEIERLRDQAMALGFSSDPSAARSLEALLSHPNEVVRATAATSLGEIGTPYAVAALTAAYAQEHSKFVRAEMASALGAAARSESAAFVNAQFGREKDRDVRAALANALGRIGDPSTAPALTARIRDKDAFVRREVIRALGAIRAGAPVALIVEALTSDSDADVRRAAAWALGAIGDPSASAALARGARDPDPYVEQESLASLARLKSSAAGAGEVR